MVRRIDLRQNSVRRVADDYLFSSAALSMFRFDMTHDSRLEMFLKLGAYLKFQQKEGILSSEPRTGGHRFRQIPKKHFDAFPNILFESLEAF